MNNTAYLVEPTSVTSTGKINGKSLRAYEVTYTAEKSTYAGGWFHSIKAVSTGKMFIIKNNQIVSKRTGASLRTKYIRNTTNVVTDKVEDMPYYGCRLYSTPELALISKAIAIKSRTTGIISHLEKQLEEAKQNLTTIPDTSEFLSQHPEHLI